MAKRNPARNRQGTVVVEMAMCLPILFLILFSCYEFARANMIRHAASAAAYEGARQGIVPGATVAEVEQRIAFVMSTVGAKNFDVQVNPATISLRDPTIEVTVRLRMKDNTSLGLLFTADAEFVGTCQLGREAL